MSKTYRKIIVDPKTWKIQKAARRGCRELYPEDLFQRLIAEHEEMYEDDDYEPKQPDTTEDF